MTNGILNYYQFITVYGIIQNSQGGNVAKRGRSVELFYEHGRFKRLSF